MLLSTANKYAKAANTTPARVERLWEQAKAKVKQSYATEDKHYWARVDAAVREELGLQDATTFKQFISQPAKNEVSTTTLNSDIGTLVNTLFSARDTAHKLHLATKSYASHMALNELYDLLVSFVDKIAEAYQGKYGIIDFSASSTAKLGSADPKVFLIQLSQWLEQDAVKMYPADDEYLTNIVDELIAAVYGVKYKIDQLS
jgi:hypothetical protein